MSTGIQDALFCAPSQGAANEVLICAGRGGHRKARAAQDFDRAFPRSFSFAAARHNARLSRFLICQQPAPIAPLRGVRRGAKLACGTLRAVRGGLNHGFAVFRQAVLTSRPDSGSSECSSAVCAFGRWRYAAQYLICPRSCSPRSGESSRRIQKAGAARSAVLIDFNKKF